MLSFKKFVIQGSDIPVISLSKETVDCSQQETRDEINDNLESGLDGQKWTNPYGGWFAAAKVLALYGIILPKVIFKDMEDGEEVVVISQFGERYGAKVDGSITTDEPEYFFYYSYGINLDGYYDSFAVVTTEDELDDYLSDDTINLDPTGEKQPPQ